VRRFLIILILLGIGALTDRVGAVPSVYFFSDCATGKLSNSASPIGGGTQSDPWCLDPGGDGVKESFDYLMNGVAPEAVANDTIYLCAGACDGTESTTYYLGSHVNAVTGVRCSIDPVINPIIGPIKIAGFPGESVTLSGDTNNDNAFDSATEPKRFWDCRIAGRPTNDSCGFNYFMHDLTIEKYAERTFNFSDGYGTWGSGLNFTLDNMILQKMGAGLIGGTAGAPTFTNGYYAPLTGDEGLNAMGIKADVINASLDNSALFIWGRMRHGAKLIIRNSQIHHLGQIVLRANGNCYNVTGSVDYEACSDGTGGALIEDNLIYNVQGLQNGHEGQNWTWRRNAIYDYFEGISFEQQQSHIIVEDNDISCRGVYVVHPSGKCRTAINAYDQGECNETPNGGDACTSHDYRIRRNRIWGGERRPDSWVPAWGNFVRRAQRSF